VAKRVWKRLLGLEERLRVFFVEKITQSCRLSLCQLEDVSRPRRHIFGCCWHSRSDCERSERGDQSCD
jgi:hypothetical protein